MLNKKKRLWEWCSYEPQKLSKGMLNKRFRCPVCKRRLVVFMAPNMCPGSCCERPTISRHKRLV